MKSYVDQSLRIDIYLDTNILVDYIEGNYPALTYSLNYLVQSGYVTFRTSQYVLYEFGEVRKYNIYLSTLNLKPEHQIIDEKKLKSQIKRDNWKYGESEYIDPVRTTIEKQVLNELSVLEENLELETNLHLLHKELYLPSLLCVLKTPISKEDGLVLTSSVLPKENMRLEYSVILSGDKAYGTAFNDSADTIATIDGLNNANIDFLKITELIDPKSGRKINLRDAHIEHSVIRDAWNHIILDQLYRKNILRFVGFTYKFKSNQRCIFFQKDKNSLPLEKDGSFMIIPNDLSFPPVYTGDGLGILYYGNHITFPHSPNIGDDRELKYSFLAPEPLKEKMGVLSQAGNLILYDTD